MENQAVETRVKWGPIRLRAGVGKKNMTVYVLGWLCAMLLSTFVPQAQPFLLNEILRIPASEQGALTGLLGLAATLVGLIMPGIWGTVSDRTGRKLVYGLGLLLAALGIILCPLAASVFALFLVRMLFATGSNAYSTMSNALLGDYIDEADRGKAIGMTAFAGGIGALLTVFIFLRLPSSFQRLGLSPASSGFYTYCIVAGIGLFAMIMVLVGLLGKSEAQARNRRGFLSIAKEALAAAKTYPGIRLAFAVNFVASGAIIAVGSFFSLWLVTYGTTHAGLSSAEALARAGMIMGISQMMGLVAAPIFGILSDKLGRVPSVCLATGLTALAFAATVLIANPLSGAMIALGLFIGFFQTSGVITGGALIAQEAPEGVRGAAMGFYGFCGALGIMTVSVLGGWLFDHWIYQGPFVLIACLSALVSIWGIFVARRGRLH